MFLRFDKERLSFSSRSEESAFKPVQKELSNIEAEEIITESHIRNDDDI
jgi:hypothetical protein